MTVDEVTMLLARIQVLDNRQVDQLTIEAWSPLMADVDYAAAVSAVNEHFRSSTAYLVPAHIVQGVAHVRRLSLPQTMSPEAIECCDVGDHRWLPDGTCMFCITKRAIEAAVTS